MKPPLWVHIGLGKCASRLVVNSIGVDHAWDRATRHPLSDWLWKGQVPDQAFNDHVQDIFAAWGTPAPGHPHFISKEPLSGLRWWPGSTNNPRDFAAWLAEQCSPHFEVHIVMVVRRQDTYFESLYNQDVVDGEARPFNEWLAERPFANFRWHELADVYADQFGADRVKVLPMERDLLVICGYANVVEAVGATIGLADWRCGPCNRIYNPSIDPQCRELQRQANAFLPEPQRRGLAEWFMANTPHVPGTPHGLLAPSRRIEIIRDYEESNQRLKPYLPKNLVTAMDRHLTLYGAPANVAPVATTEE